MAQLSSVDLSASNAHNISAREQNVYTLRDIRRERMLAMSEGASVSAVTVSHTLATHTHTSTHIQCTHNTNARVQYIS